MGLKWCQFGILRVIVAGEDGVSTAASGEEQLIVDVDLRNWRRRRFGGGRVFGTSVTLTTVRARISMI
jgi:hypothetical protein